MRGGLVVRNEGVAGELSELPENRGQVITVGSRVAMPPCLPQHTIEDQSQHWNRQGRPCPYIDLDPRNDTAAHLVFNHLPEHTRPLTAALASAMLADASNDERADTLLRVSAALRSEAVIEKLYPLADNMKE